MDVYLFESYKLVLKAGVDEGKLKPHQPLSFRAMAEHCRVQKTYLSKVLNRDGDLNADQLFLACDYLDLDADASEFTFLLHSLETCSIAKRKNDLIRQIQKIRSEKQRTESSTKVSQLEVDPRTLTKYYLDPMCSVVHMYLTINRYAKNPKLIAEDLGFSKAKVGQYLEILEEMKIVSLDKGVYRVVRDDIHLPKESELITGYRTMMRLKALERMNQSDAADPYSFSVIFSAGHKCRAQVQSKFMKFLTEVQELTEKTSEEAVYQMNFDLLNWTPKAI